MLQTDNVTIIGLTGIIALIFAISQLILLRKNGKMIPLWSLGQAFIGLGLIGILALVKDPLPDNWVLAPTAILLGYLVCLAALGKWSGFKLPKKPMLICGGGVVLTAVLFQFSRQVGAPLGSLEAILLAPLAATLIYSGWFAGVQAKSFHSAYIYVISGIYWAKGLLMAALTLGALAAIGDQYIIVTSDVVKVTGVAFLMSTIINNMVWSLQNAQDILVGHLKSDNPVSEFANAQTTKSTKSKVQSDNKITVDNSSLINPSLLNEEKVIKSDKKKTEEKIVTDLTVLSQDEKLALVAKLTDKEKEVFLLAAEGKKNGEIATILNASEASVKVHRSRMTSKLGLKSVEQLAELRNATSQSSQSTDSSKLIDPINPNQFGLT